MTVEQRLMLTLEALTPARRQEILDFAEFLRSRMGRPSTSPQGDLTPLPVFPGRAAQGWKDAVYGKR